MWKDIGLIGMFLALLVGCHLVQHQAASKPDPVDNAISGVAGIQAHTQSAERHVQKAVGHTDIEGRVLLTAASDEHKEVLSDAAETQTALAKAQDQIDTLRGELEDQKVLYTKLDSQWYVIWGRRIERALWMIGITWLVCGVASVLLGMGNPLSLTWRIGKEITRLLPAMNVFSWIRDWILSRRTAGVGA